MCKWGTTVTLPLVIPARLSHTGKARFDLKDVDACIAPIVKAFNDTGVQTIASCCGHGKQPGTIALADGREVRIMTYEQAREVNKLFPPINDRAAPTEGEGE